MDVEELKLKLIESGEKISKAERVKSLIKAQKGLWKKQLSLTDFDEPVMFFHRRSGRIEFHQRVTAGKFSFEHSDGGTRYIELRPEDQETFDYGDKKVKCYDAHEDYPFAGFPRPIVDSEQVMLGYEKTKATDLKYQERIQALKNKGRMSWVWIILGVALAIAIIALAYNAWIAPAQLAKSRQAAEVAKAGIPTVGTLLMKLNYRRKKWQEKKGL